ncbi:MAG: ATP-binding cassette domain-containing protein [Spirochaetales bacterium]|nr:ATP-binding cassette domain-containing protein [Spirochaetales bacterium]
MSLEFDLQFPRRDFLLDIQGEFDDQTIGIFGPSGAGKTSFFSLLTGLETPEKGRIVLGGRVLTDTSKGLFVPVHKRRIGVVFQEKLLFPHLTIRENILFGERYALKKNIGLDEVAELLGLGSLLDSMPYEASGGEQQRTTIARALLTSPDMLLLDEPFNAMDNSLRATILPYLRNLRDRLNIPFLVISHDLPDIQRLTNRIYFMEQGRCAGFGNSLDFYGDRVTRDSGFVNSFRLSDPQQTAPGLFSCAVEGNPELRLTVPKAPADTFSLVVSPRAVALSRKRVEGLSVRNQIRGTISRIIQTETHILCIIDAGVRIASQVTVPAARELELKEGSEVYCLIKALSFRS